MFGEAVAHLMGRHVQAHQGIEGGGTVTEGHLAAVPEGVLVVAAVVHPHLELEAQRRRVVPVAVHVEHHVAEVVGIVEGGVGAVDLLDPVLRAAELVHCAPTGGVIEVDGVHVAAAHAAAVIHLEGTKIGAIEVLAGLEVAARASGVLVIDPLPALELAAALGIYHHEGTARLLARSEPGDQVDQAGLTGLILHHEQLDLLVAALGSGAGFEGSIGRGEGGGRARQVGIYLAQHGAGHLVDLAPQGLIGHQHLTPDRDALPGLLITHSLLAVGQLDDPYLAKLAIPCGEGAYPGGAAHSAGQVGDLVHFHLFCRHGGASPAGQYHGQIDFVHLVFP